MKIIIADDNILLRRSIIRSVESYDNTFQFHEANNGREAIELEQSVKADIMLLDIRMPVLNGVEVINALRANHATCKVIVLTQLVNPILIMNLLKMGISGFISKNIDITKLINTIQKVHKDGQHFEPEIQDLVCSGMKDIENLPTVKFSVREFQIITLLKDGKSSKEISKILNLSALSIDTYRKALMKKTKTENIAHLISYSYETGIL